MLLRLSIPHKGRCCGRVADTRVKLVMLKSVFPDSEDGTCFAPVAGLGKCKALWCMGSTKRTPPPFPELLVDGVGWALSDGDPTSRYDYFFLANRR